MTLQSTAANDYIGRLESALAQLPASVRNEILAGVTEELAGLDDERAASAIRSLGDPEFIAAEARAELGGAQTSTAERVDAAASAPQPTEPAWLAIVAALLVMLGGVLVPVLGWIAGIALVWRSVAWSTRQKWTATLLPALVSVGFVAITVVVRLLAPNDDDGRNPLIPGWYDIMSSLIFMPAIIGAITGVWLLTVARKIAP